MSASVPRVARTPLGAAVCATLLAVTLGADVALSQRDADSFQRKLVQIVERGQAPARTPRETPVTEDEVNAYFKFHAADQIPNGVVDPRVTILGQGRLLGRAVVDLDAVARQRPRAWLDPLRYLGGRLPVVATGVLHARNGAGRIDIESVQVGGLGVPRLVLQEVVTYYSRTPENPDGVDLDAPFELPARIREIRVGKGRAIIVQ